MSIFWIRTFVIALSVLPLSRGYAGRTIYGMSNICSVRHYIYFDNPSTVAQTLTLKLTAMLGTFSLSGEDPDFTYSGSPDKTEITGTRVIPAGGSRLFIVYGVTIMRYEFNIAEDAGFVRANASCGSSYFPLEANDGRAF